VTSPVSGAIVAWDMVGNYSGGPFKLHPSTYMKDASASPASPARM
jgi:hypothetical protein